ncbi:tRNA lysidine(34) synthetase TilS [Bradymonas sediminis]|uniref:tRNA lysidine(34) synthetase TilS n=1 Tax=Bradymonas sediminis TaxID=1548548 RepID=UPI0010DA035D|nr:tRNA lysidine(34) synthetase TilS [Bradymonas sediminis]TDP76783.1 tRNA(Ile)-lysidine synthetase-like protein/tRNA(Ile)-lysidine synthetase-like protein [Bradymonas sediminis]
MSELSLELRPELAAAGILVAWSGGLDSTVLLYLLREWAAEHGAQLHALHIDHRLRASSGEDVAFCRRVAANLGVSFSVETLAVSAAGSTQQNARVQRYATLARAANRLGLGVVATAHHADDALETALLNLRRGTSSAGLSSAARVASAPIPAWPCDIRLERPMRGIFRREIRAFALANKIAWHEDPSNATSNYQRNQLRHETLPDLTGDGRYSRGILRSLENLAAENQALDDIAKSTLQAATLTPPDAESVALRAEPFHTLPPAIVTRALQLAARLLPTEVGLTRGHRDQLAEAVATGATLRLDVRGAVIHITPRAILLEVARGRGAPHLHQREAAAIPLKFPIAGEKYPLEIPWFGSTFAWQNNGSADDFAVNPALVYVFGVPSAAPGTPLMIRGARPGDRIRISGLDGHKSVTALLAEANIPDFLRWRWPCLVAADGSNLVAWVCGIRHAEQRVGAAADARPAHLQWKPRDGSIFSMLLSKTSQQCDRQ